MTAPITISHNSRVFIPGIPLFSSALYKYDIWYVVIKNIKHCIQVDTFMDRKLAKKILINVQEFAQLLTDKSPEHKS